MKRVTCHLAAIVSLGYIIAGAAVFIDKGDPYKKGQLPVKQLELTKADDRAPLHTVVYYPAATDEFVPVFFVGGWRGFFLAEWYADFLSLVASHGFVVFGVDPDFPVLEEDDVRKSLHDVGVNINKLFEQLQWLKGNTENRTASRIAWNQTVLACHSAGCDLTLRMIQHDGAVAQASVFLEPYGTTVQSPVATKMPVLAYGTELSESAYPQCCRKGSDWRTFYGLFPCPRVLTEVKVRLGKVEACHDLNFCVTTNNTRNSAYHLFAQGVVSAFLTGTLEGYTDNLKYLVNSTNIPLELLDLRVDLNC